MPIPDPRSLTPDPASGSVVSRFAPSPTGELHIGGARTALYAWAFARRFGGTFQLRFEDTDLARSSDASAERILGDLLWLGLTPDNYDPAQGPASIPRQSERHQQGRYDQVVQQLLEHGDAYQDGDAVRFRMGTHRGDVTFDDAVYGTIHTPAADLEDFIIRKGAAGGKMPTFHLAVVVDDHDFGCTHVIRGQEHLTNTAKHAALCDALGWTRPTWAHTPSIMNPGGSKMSKRDKKKAIAAEVKATGQTIEQLSDLSIGGPLDAVGKSWLGHHQQSLGVSHDELVTRYREALSGESDDPELIRIAGYRLNLHLPEIEVADFRRSGYLPGPLLNYVALLGWNPGNDVEHFGLDDLAQHFDLGRINKGNSTFDRAKLASFNQDAILKMSLDEFEVLLRSHFEQFHPDKLEALGENFRVFSDAYWERSKTLDDPAHLGAFVFRRPTEYDDKAVKKNLTKNDGEGLKTLQHVREALTNLPGAWDMPTIRAALEQAVADLQGPHLGHVAQPLRVALTGTAVSPEIDATLALLGKAETLERINHCLMVHTNPAP